MPLPFVCLFLVPEARIREIQHPVRLIESDSLEGRQAELRHHLDEGGGSGYEEVCCRWNDETRVLALVGCMR